MTKMMAKFALCHAIWVRDETKRDISHIRSRDARGVAGQTNFELLPLFAQLLSPPHVRPSGWSENNRYKTMCVR